MADQISEADWKWFRVVYQRALERFCEEAMAKFATITNAAKPSAHQRYLQLYQRIHQSDRELTDLFNDLRRSTALLKLAGLRAHNLVTDDDFAAFSTETKTAISLIGYAKVLWCG